MLTSEKECADYHNQDKYKMTPLPKILHHTNTASVGTNLSYEGKNGDQYLFL